MALFMRFKNLFVADPGNAAARTAAVRLPLFDDVHPVVSVVIPAYNEERLIELPLRSLAVQDFSEPFEVIVVDNDSSDRTADIAKEFGAHVIHESRKGVGQARETGFRASRAGIIATTDADTVVPPDWLRTIVSRYEKDAKLFAFGGFPRHHSLPMVQRFILNLSFGPVLFFDRLITGGSMLGYNMSVRREAFEAVGGFNTGLRVGEDADLAIRINKIGKIILDPRCVVFTSGRRFAAQGLLGAAVFYFYVAVARLWLKKANEIDLPTIRDENDTKK